MTVLDIYHSRFLPRDLNILKAELKRDHRVRERMFMLDFLPENSIGAELGVYTGLFSSVLSRHDKFAKITFVDPWWLMYGDFYPDWGSYTDSGRVRTRSALHTAMMRIVPRANRSVEITRSYDWLSVQRDESLDWIYIDSTHTYNGTKKELEIAARKIKESGLICGDDWSHSREHRHHGVPLAVNDFVRKNNFEFVLCGRNAQWIVRRRLKDPTVLPLLWEDKVYSDAVIAKNPN